MLNRVGRYTILFLVLTFISCPQKYVNGDPEVYIVVYTINYFNATDFDFIVSKGSFTFPTKNDNAALFYPDFHTTIERNSSGSFSISWVYTWHFFVREPFMDRGGSISSFYLKLCSSQNDYSIIAGWPEDVYALYNIISYGHGWGFGVSSVGVIQGEELMEFVFDDLPHNRYKEQITAKANLYINSIDNIVFQLTEFPRPRFLK